MLAEISAGLASLKSATDLVKALNTVKEATAVQQVQFELQRLLLAAQESLFTAQEGRTTDARRIADLEQEISGLKDWFAEKERYQLVDVWQGNVAFMPKAGAECGEPPHWLCSNCFNQGRKSFLVVQGHMGPDAIWMCNGCKGTMKIGARVKPNYSSRS